MAPEQAAGSRGEPRARHRRLQPGRDPLSDAHRPAAVSGGHAGRDGVDGARARAAAAAAAQSAGRSRPGNDRAEVPAKAARPALCQRDGPGRRPRGLPGRRADRGTLGRVQRRSIARAFRETHHATVLENWGLLWMWHSLALLVMCVLTNALQWRGIGSPWPYLVLWTAGLGTWATIFWSCAAAAGR